VTSSSDDAALLERLRAGDEGAFMELVDRLTPVMRRVARMYVSTDAVADEVVQEAWLGVLKGLDRFEGRSSLRTWILRIVSNTAKTRGVREGRSVPFASLSGPDEPAWDPADFRPADAPEWPGHWASIPSDWSTLPEDRVLSSETFGVIREAVDALPPMQAQVIRLRDVLGWTGEEVRNALDLTETNQRVLLHRARAKVRRALDAYFEASATEEPAG
jgi:RNA polymerase sigma-70 factor (ECF subfamily)